MKISIAMATYNGAQYIQEQLQSFVDQTRQPDELIITDDCSTDQTEAIVCEFAKTAPFTVAFHRNEKNLGYCRNFNAALTKTTGDMVFLSDQDDFWFPDKIEHMIGVAERHPQALVVMNDAALTDGELNEVGLTKVGQIRSAGFSMESFVMGCCCAFRRSLLGFCLPIPAGFETHDKWLVQFADRLNAKVVDAAILQYYRRHETNESQFIANRTTKVTRAQARLHSFKSLLKNNAFDQVSAQLAQTRLFAEGVKRACELAPSGYYDALVSLDQRYGKQIAVTEKRLAIIEKPFFSRVMAVISLFRIGGYQDADGYRSVIRDIVG